MKQGAPETETTTTPIENQEEKVEVHYRQTCKCIYYYKFLQISILFLEAAG